MGQSCISKLADDHDLHKYNDHHGDAGHPSAQKTPCVKDASIHVRKQHKQLRENVSTSLSLSAVDDSSCAISWTDEDAIASTQPMASTYTSKATSLASTPRHSLINSLAFTSSGRCRAGSSFLVRSTSGSQTPHAHNSSSKDIKDTVVVSSSPSPSASVSHPLAVRRSSVELLEQKTPLDNKNLSTKSRSPYHGRHVSDGMLLHSQRSSLFHATNSSVPHVILERNDQGRFTSPAASVDVSKSPYVDTCRLVGARHVHPSPRNSDSKSSSSSKSMSSSSSSQRLSSHATHSSSSSSISSLPPSNSTSRSTSDNSDSQESVSSHLSSVQPQDVELKAMQPGKLDPSASPLDLSRTSSPVIEPYECHENIDDLIVYRAIASYHREFRDEGLGPSWFTAHQLMKQQELERAVSDSERRSARQSSARVIHIANSPYERRRTCSLTVLASTSTNPSSSQCTETSHSNILGFLREFHHQYHSVGPT